LISKNDTFQVQETASIFMFYPLEFIKITLEDKTSI